MTDSDFNLHQITEEEKKRERENLMDSSSHVSGDSIDGMIFYKVSFYICYYFVYSVNESVNLLTFIDYSGPSSIRRGLDSPHARQKFAE